MIDDLDPFAIDINRGGAVLLLIAFVSGLLGGGYIAAWWLG